MKTTWENLFAEVEVLEDRLRNPSDFYQEKESSYHAAAAAIARRVLLAARPPETPPDQWRLKVQRIVQRVTSHLMLSGVGGMVVSVSALSEDDGELDTNKDTRPDSQNMSYEEIFEWVKAGQNGAEGAKRWTALDHKRYSDAGGGDKGYGAIATIVMRAYYSHKPSSSYVRLRRAIQRYVHGSQESAGEPLLDAIATAWEQHFSIRLKRDLRQHAAKLIRQM